ncbi:MAG TPA: hypothetical protein VL979_15060 [Solirubrobacteraceae bacterium]|nr:hypothetical protein [Solirubrobacteraceae bacterium]
MSCERVLNLALRVYPREVRASRGPEMRDTVLEASGGSRAKLLRESLALAGAGMRARRSTAASLLLGRRACATLNLRAVASRVATTYTGEWRSLLPTSALLIATIALFRASWVSDSAAVSIVSQFVILFALASFTAFVVSCGVSSGGHRGVRAALSAARSTAGEMALVIFLASISLTLLVDLARVAVIVVLGLVFGAGPNLSAVTGLTGGAITGAEIEAAVGAMPFVALLTLWSVALPVVVIERPGQAHALARSRELVRGNRLRTLVVVAGVIGVVEGARLVGSLPATAAGGIAAAILWWLVAPIPILAATALYLELGEAHIPERYAE